MRSGGRQCNRGKRQRTIPWEGKTISQIAPTSPYSADDLKFITETLSQASAKSPMGCHGTVGSLVSVCEISQAPKARGAQGQRPCFCEQHFPAPILYSFTTVKSDLNYFKRI